MVEFPVASQMEYSCSEGPDSTWLRGGGRLDASGTEELDMRGVEPASLSLFASNLKMKKNS